MYTKKTLVEDLNQLNLNPTGTVLVHSSYKSVGDVKGGPDTVLDSLSDFMKDGLLILPTHTWEYINSDNPTFNVQDSPSNVGILTEKFRQRSGVYRSEHPTHSVAALGREAEVFIEGEFRHDTPCARASVWGKLVDKKAKILLIGVDLTKNTYIHGIEEWLDIPNRLTDTHEELFSILHDGRKVSVPSRRHHGLSWSNHFWKVEEILLEEEAMETGTFGDATVRVVDAEKTASLLTELLTANPDLFSDNDPLEDKWRYYFHRTK